MMEARDVSETRKGQWKECKQPLESDKGKETGSPLRASEEGTRPADTLTLA